MKKPAGLSQAGFIKLYLRFSCSLKRPQAETSNRRYGKYTIIKSNARNHPGWGAPDYPLPNSMSHFKDRLPNRGKNSANKASVVILIQ
jgi:hypothetical protein